MSPMINDDELIILFKLSSEKDPMPTTLFHSAVSVDSLVEKGYAECTTTIDKRKGLIITADGRWKYSSMVGISPPVPRKITQLMKQKGLQ